MLFGNIHKSLDAYRTVPGAVSIPLSAITSTLLSKDAPLFLYCLRGTRSRRAAGILKKIGYTKVKSSGGIKNDKGAVVK